MILKDKIVLVTGGSSGIGEAIAVGFAKEGATVLINYRKNLSGAEKVLAEVRKYSDGDIYRADLIKKENTEKLFTEISKKHKYVDILINCAGDGIPGDMHDEKMWKYQFDNNFFSAVNTSNAFLNLEAQNNLRKIINISSIYGIIEMGDTDFIQYSAAKAALNSYTFTLARKVGPTVLVNAVAPGWTMTPPWQGAPETSLQHCRDLMEIKRFIHPEEIADLVIAMAKNDALTGEIYKLDGGLKSPVV